MYPTIFLVIAVALLHRLLQQSPQPEAGINKLPYIRVTTFPQLDQFIFWLISPHFANYL